MQLRAYSEILWRRWPIVLLLPLLVGGLSLALALRQPPRYQALVKLMVTRSLVDTAGAATLPDFNDSYSWNTTEFILDDLPQVIGSALYAEDVRAAVAANGYALDVGTIQGNLRAEVLHRSVFLTAVAGSPELALAMVRGAVAALDTNGLKYWGRAPAGGGGLQVVVLDPASGAVAVGGLRDLLLDVGLRTALGLLAGVGLASLLHYLDDRLRSAGQAEQWVGVRVLAVIPKE